jgi:hypothetical protein
VTSVWGRSPELPERVLDAVHRQACALGRTVASDDLFLLAISELDDAQPARRALAAGGIDSARLMAHIKVEGDAPLDPAEGLHYAPAFYLMLGRAQAFAATLGDGTITPEHVVLALLWDPATVSSSLVRRLGTTREQVVNSLRDLGVSTPAAELPRQCEIEWGPRVWFDRADVAGVIDNLRARIPPGTRWGFNYEGDRAWAIADSSIDLAAFVSAAKRT